MLLAIVMLGGCANMSKTEKTIATIAVGIIVVGVINSASSGGGSAVKPCNDPINVNGSNSDIRFASCP